MFWTAPTLAARAGSVRRFAGDMVRVSNGDDSRKLALVPLLRRNDRHADGALRKLRNCF